MSDLSSIRNFVISHLKEGLSPLLTYHNIQHTLDVADKSKTIARIEGITDCNTLELLEIAALFHDTGFLKVYKNHEEAGCAFAREYLPQFGLSESEIQSICKMIMATRIPQLPRTQLEQIICDADLDYLGREDFFRISESLHKEFLAYGIVQSDEEWEEKQLKFFEMHSYFTETNKKLRTPVKLYHLEILKNKASKSSQP